jgi:hypothetical protein
VTRLDELRQSQRTTALDCLVAELPAPPARRGRAGPGGPRLLFAPGFDSAVPVFRPACSDRRTDPRSITPPMSKTRD